MEHIIQQNMCCESSEKREHSSGQLFIRCSGSLALPQTATIRQIALRDAQSGTARMRKNQHRESGGALYSDILSIVRRPTPG